MTKRRFATDGAAGMMIDTDESHLDDEDMDYKDDESDFMDIDISDVGDESDPLNDSASGDAGDWRRWLPHDPDFFHFPFTAQHVGPNFEQTTQSELECFQNFMTDELLTEIVEAANAYDIYITYTLHFIIHYACVILFKVVSNFYVRVEISEQKQA